MEEDIKKNARYNREAIIEREKRFKELEDKRIAR
jgi:hypothetical protein